MPAGSWARGKCLHYQKESLHRSGPVVRALFGQRLASRTERPLTSLRRHAVPGGRFNPKAAVRSKGQDDPLLPPGGMPETPRHPSDCGGKVGRLLDATGARASARGPPRPDRGGPCGVSRRRRRCIRDRAARRCRCGGGNECPGRRGTRGDQLVALGVDGTPLASRQLPGVIPVRRLNARLNAVSDSYPTLAAMLGTLSCPRRRRSAASWILQPAR